MLRSKHRVVGRFGRQGRRGGRYAGCRSHMIRFFVIEGFGGIALDQGYIYVRLWVEGGDIRTAL
jgi:hypothetical protein